MKVLSKILLGSFVLVTLAACKKGEDDPFLSFRSRDARITGEWEMTASEYTEEEEFVSNGETLSESFTSSYDGEEWTITATDVDGTDTTYSGGKEKVYYTINKDNTYTFERTQGDTLKDSFTESWWWEDGVKNKTRLALGDDAGCFLVQRLTNKEMVLTYSAEYKDEDGDEVYTERVSISSTFKKNK